MPPTQTLSGLTAGPDRRPPGGPPLARRIRRALAMPLNDGDPDGTAASATLMHAQGLAAGVAVHTLSAPRAEEPAATVPLVGGPGPDGHGVIRFRPDPGRRLRTAAGAGSGSADEPGALARGGRPKSGPWPLVAAAAAAAAVLVSVPLLHKADEQTGDVEGLDHAAPVAVLNPGAGHNSGATLDGSPGDRVLQDSASPLVTTPHGDPRPTSTEQGTDKSAARHAAVPQTGPLPFVAHPESTQAFTDPLAPQLPHGQRHPTHTTGGIADTPSVFRPGPVVGTPGHAVPFQTPEGRAPFGAIVDTTPSPAAHSLLAAPGAHDTHAGSAARHTFAAVHTPPAAKAPAVAPAAKPAQAPAEPVAHAAHHVVKAQEDTAKHPVVPTAVHPAVHAEHAATVVHPTVVHAPVHAEHAIPVRAEVDAEHPTVVHPTVVAEHPTASAQPTKAAAQPTTAVVAHPNASGEHVVLVHPMVSTKKAEPAAKPAAKPAAAAPRTWGTRVVGATTVLTAGQSVATDHVRLGLTSGGDLVVTDMSGTVLWSAHTSGAGNRAVFQGDGSLAVYSPDDQALWTSGTAGNLGAELVLQGDGNVTILSWSGAVVWSAGTVH